MKEENLINSIRPLVERIQASYQMQYEWAKAEVYSIVTMGHRGNSERLGKVLDVLSETALFGVGEDLFRYFLAYVYAIDVEMADFYTNSYLEMTSDDIDEDE